MARLKPFTQESIRANFTLIEANVQKDKHNKYMSKVMCNQCKVEYILNNNNLKTQPNKFCKSCSTKNRHRDGKMNTEAWIKAGIKASTKHGLRYYPIYQNWSAMINRCKSNDSYVKRNITVCEEWLHINVFKDWAESNGYKEGLTIDRINPTKGYYPENCQWLRRSENSRKGNVEDRAYRYCSIYSKKS